MAISIRHASADDAALLHSLARETFALACPPDTLPESVAEFISLHLSETRFAGYLADPTRELLIGEIDGTPVGYTMLVVAEPSDPDVVAVLSASPTAELSKFYVLATSHGSGVSAALMAATVAAAAERGAAALWLGVNQQNARANRFYEKNGFRQVGIKHFQVGGRLEDDYVRELVLA